MRKVYEGLARNLTFWKFLTLTVAFIAVSAFLWMKWDKTPAPAEGATDWYFWATLTLQATAAVIYAVVLFGQVLAKNKKTVETKDQGKPKEPDSGSFAEFRLYPKVCRWALEYKGSKRGARKFLQEALAKHGESLFKTAEQKFGGNLTETPVWMIANAPVSEEDREDASEEREPEEQKPAKKEPLKLQGLTQILLVGFLAVGIIFTVVQLAGMAVGPVSAVIGNFDMGIIPWIAAIGLIGFLIWRAPSGKRIPFSVMAVIGLLVVRSVLAGDSSVRAYPRTETAQTQVATNAPVDVEESFEPSTFDPQVDLSRIDTNKTYLNAKEALRDATFATASNIVKVQSDVVSMLNEGKAQINWEKLLRGADGQMGYEESLNVLREWQAGASETSFSSRLGKALQEKVLGVDEYTKLNNASGLLVKCYENIVLMQKALVKPPEQDPNWANASAFYDLYLGCAAEFNTLANELGLSVGLPSSLNLTEAESGKELHLITDVLMKAYDSEKERVLKEGAASVQAASLVKPVNPIPTLIAAASVTPAPPNAEPTKIPPPAGPSGCEYPYGWSEEQFRGGFAGSYPTLLEATIVLHSEALDTENGNKVYQVPSEVLDYKAECGGTLIALIGASSQRWQWAIVKTMPEVFVKGDYIYAYPTEGGDWSVWKVSWDPASKNMQKTRTAWTQDRPKDGPCNPETNPGYDATLLNSHWKALVFVGAYQHATWQACGDGNVRITIFRGDGYSRWYISVFQPPVPEGSSFFVLYTPSLPDSFLAQYGYNKQESCPEGTSLDNDGCFIVREGTMPQIPTPAP